MSGHAMQRSEQAAGRSGSDWADGALRVQFLLTIEPRDIGRQLLTRARALGDLGYTRVVDVGPVLGKVLAGDVGRRVYLFDGAVTVETAEQRYARVRREGPDPRD